MNPKVDPSLPRGERLALLRRLIARPVPALQVERLSTGLTPLDQLLDGGLPRGRITELSGSCGRMSLALYMLATTQRRGLVVAFIDLSDGLDPRCAADAGVDLTRLLWARPLDAPRALRAADLLVGIASLGLIVLGLANRPLPRRAGHAFTRLRHRSEQSGVPLLLLSDEPVAGTAAAVGLRCERVELEWVRAPGNREVFVGSQLDVELYRNRHGACGGRARLRLRR